MLSDIHQRLYDSRVMRRLAARLNKLPLPYRRMVVNVLGQRMTAHTVDRYLALWFWKMRLLEYEVLGILPRLCSPGMKILDVGANIGLYTLLFAKYVGSTGHVWAYEPDHGNADTLKHNLSLNGHSNVTVDTRAVGAKTETGTLFLSDSHQGDHRLFQGDDSRRGVGVEVVALDDEFKNDEQVDIVKIDVQGVEEFVLMGMEKLLSRSTALTVIVEIVEDELAAPNCSASSAVARLESLGFRLAYVDTNGAKIVPVNSIDAFLVALTGKQYLNLLATKNEQVDWSTLSQEHA